MALTASDTRGVWQLSNELLHADTMEALIGLLFDEGRHLFPFDSAVFFPLDGAQFRPIETGHLGRGIDAEHLAGDYAQHYYRLDPLRILERPDNQNRALRTSDVISQRKFRGSEIRQDFFGPVGIDKVMGVCVVGGDTPMCGLGLHRERHARPFSIADRERLTLLAPSIAHGLERLRLREMTDRLMKDDLRGPGSDVAVWQLDVAFRLHERNAAADELASLWRRPGMRKTEPLFPKAVQALIETLSNSRNGGSGIPNDSGSVSCFIDGQWHMFTVTRIGGGLGEDGDAATLVTAVRRSLSLDLERALQGLAFSAREKEIARLVMGGQSNKEIANSLRIVEQTVKDHLRSIYAKADVSSRSRLIARLLGTL